MKLKSCSFSYALWIALSFLAFSPFSARAQSCQTASDLDEATRTSITTVGQRYFGVAAGLHAKPGVRVLWDRDHD